MAVIAVARCSKLPDYEAAIEKAGGTPRVIDRSTPAEEALRGAAGLLLAGGGDVDPILYGETKHPTFDPSEPGRDEYEVELVRRALEADMPVLAICRGIQLLNVARGGTLVQHIPAEIATTIEHRLAAPPHQPIEIAHEVQVDRASALAAALASRLRGGEALEVNSRHHQALKRPGQGLIVTATAADGVIEAVEDPNRRFCVGVQWHPENFWRTGEFQSLFEAFVRAGGR